MKYLLAFLLWLPGVVFGSDSVCYGTTSDGRLENGVELPRSGPNFVTYSDVARLAGRTYVHSEVHEILIAAYSALEKELPDKIYKYAETGFKDGGQFSPHKTHRNGLSVDFMTPMMDKDGKSVHLPTYPWNKFGYNIELDEQGHYEDLSIDYDALAAHIVALDRAAKYRGHTLWRVIFDPKLQPGLFDTEYGEYIKANIQLSQKRSWVRHDEHYHVDFVVPCK
ncbi:MAG: penicillin-insensitive murein endopeptidase [Pseudomonadota bacterium]|nr:penicillin-insensitive murein endopeptidase [Pseudomonadota bacterium]